MDSKEGEFDEDAMDDEECPLGDGQGAESSDSGQGDEDVEDQEEEEEHGEGMQEDAENELFLPGVNIDAEEELTYDSSAYHMYHQAQTGAPCLSFDIMKDLLGESRTEYPMTAYIVAGTQAAPGKQNFVIVLKMSQLNETMNEDEEEEEETVDDEPELETGMLKHSGGVNRIRYAPMPGRHIAATWSDTGKVHIWDLGQQVIEVDNPLVATGSSARHVDPLSSFTGHQSEGFAMDWSTTVKGRLLTGDCKRNIHLWNLKDDSTWHVDQRPFNAHKDSVEDIQWSPNEQNVFASCSVDQTVRIWDARCAPSKACMLTNKAHDADVNVISWNRNEPFIVSGGDDGFIKVWDLRQFQEKGPAVAVFKHHTAPITSVEWHPTDSSVFAASGADNQITLWDLAVETDDTQASSRKKLDVPPQLLFIHMGQKDIKEIHWHPQLPGVVISTAESGFNIFKSISV